jgi:hypothetical protein
VVKQKIPSPKVILVLNSLRTEFFEKNKENVFFPENG